MQALTLLVRRAGPFVLDLGDMLYAPNCFRDGRGRHVMVAWLQEHASRQTAFDYSGCITLPRVLTLAGESCTCSTPFVVRCSQGAT